MVEPWLREALIKLNPEIATHPDRADEVIYNQHVADVCIYYAKRL